MLSEKQIAQLRAPFPVEALSADTSRGFELTSIKAAYVVERLNEVFGPCGCGWRYVHASFEWIEGEVLTEVALQFKVAEGGCDPVVWNSEARTWAYASLGAQWSWPVFSPGGRRPGKGNAPLTDARKGAITDGLTKAASMIGVGQEVFKGLVRTGQNAQGAPARVQPPRAPKQSSTNGKGAQNGLTGPVRGNESAAVSEKPQADVVDRPVAESPAVNVSADNVSAPKINGATTVVNATTFWSLANKHIKTLDRAVVSALAKQVIDGTMSWLEAQSQLGGLIDAATLPTFGQANGNAVHEQPSAMPVVAQAADPLDELFK